jgi:hypothetical protein
VAYGFSLTFSRDGPVRGLPRLARRLPHPRPELPGPAHRFGDLFPEPCGGVPDLGYLSAELGKGRSRFHVWLLRCDGPEMLHFPRRGGVLGE